MSENAYDVDKFFKQDLVTKKVTSFSIGPVWLYFYRETLIGYRNMDEDNEVSFLDASTPMPDDHYTSQHLVTTAIVKEAYDEAQAEQPPPLVSYDELCNRALKAVLKSCSIMVDKQLGLNTKEQEG